ncbi:hypothetical protein [Myceligenerans xiligouense]|uniref:Uncharacterized protein n=1 Tax=Myceligenerans xiligouense TaxID=253184 RepID=A0A3N4YN47_9MICO|nr:hypothetical protein [Myceligenerans xiligouense]RPF20886.1 hypothetical protein EDD34_1493 [Myceligenerans xiligouense]
MTTPDADAEAPSTVPGTTTIAARALEHLATRLVQDAAHAARRDVSVRLADAGGGMRVSVTVPVVLGAHTTGSIAERGSGLRRSVIEGMRVLAGRSVTTVDVRYSGVRRNDARRVR